MKKTLKLMIAAVLPALLLSSAMAARVDMPKPGEAPVQKVTVSEKADMVTMTFVVDSVFNFSKLEGGAIFTTEKGKADKDVKPKVTKQPTAWTLTFTIPKTDLDRTIMNLTYKSAAAKGDDFGSNVNVVHLKVGEHYKSAKGRVSGGE